METNVQSILVFTAFGLMVAVTGGVLYLTLAEWRDRRRQEREQRTQRTQRPRRKI